jgi:TonB family protein
MINRITLLLFIGLAWGQTTIAVFDLENNGLQDSEVRILTDRLQSELVKVGNYTVVERKKIEKIFEEQKFQMSGCVEECLIEIGMLLGAKEIVIGSVGRFGSTYTISARLVNASTGEMIQSSDFDTDGSIDGLLKTGMQIIAMELSGQEVLSNDQEDKVSLYDSSKNMWWSKNGRKPNIVFTPYDDPPVPMSPITPIYPDIAQEAGIEGVVIVQTFIDEIGEVTSTAILKGVPESGLDEAAMESIQNTRFKPARRRFKNIGVWISIPVNFRLK